MNMLCLTYLEYMVLIISFLWFYMPRIWDSNIYYHLITVLVVWTVLDRVTKKSYGVVEKVGTSAYNVLVPIFYLETSDTSLFILQISQCN